MREMKDSGVKWIGEIPQEWKYNRLKNVLKERKELNNPVKSKNILSLTNDKGVIPYSEKGNQGNRAKEDVKGYKLAYPNDIVMNSMNVVIGSVGLSQYYGCVSPVYYMLYSEEYDIRYYNYIFQTKVFQNELRGLGNGILEIRMRIPMEKMNNVILPIPNKKEQEQIANFLDEKVTEIDNIIEKTRNTIEDYKKYKQAIITKAVTIELQKDSTKRLKGSRKYKIKYLADINPKSENAICEDDEVTYTPMEYIKNGYYIPNTGLWKNNTSSYNTYLENDIVMAKVTPCFENGNIAIMNNLVKGIGYGSSELIVFRCNKNIENRYLFYLLQSEILKKHCVSTMTGTGGLKRVSIDFIKNYVCYIPEKKEEQINIVNYLESTCREIDILVKNKEKLIIELQNYKKTLIYEYVTGKKEVL